MTMTTEIATRPTRRFPFQMPTLEQKLARGLADAADVIRDIELDKELVHCISGDHTVTFGDLCCGDIDGGWCKDHCI